jgi:hypothetical protein
METMMAAEAGFGVVPLEQVRTMDGLTLIKGLMEGRFPAPPISEVLGFDIAEAESGRVVFTYTPVFGHYNPLCARHDRQDRPGQGRGQGDQRRLAHRHVGGQALRRRRQAARARHDDLPDLPDVTVIPSEAAGRVAKSRDLLLCAATKEEVPPLRASRSGRDDG